MKKILFVLGIIGIILSTGCVNVINVQQCLPPAEPFGFWYGIWDGMISQFSFIGSLFSDDIGIYAINNNGWPYNFGFTFGIGWMIKLISLTIKEIRKV